MTDTFLNEKYETVKESVLGRCLTNPENRRVEMNSKETSIRDYASNNQLAFQSEKTSVKQIWVNAIGKSKILDINEVVKAKTSTFCEHGVDFYFEHKTKCAVVQIIDGNATLKAFIESLLPGKLETDANWLIDEISSKLRIITQDINTTKLDDELDYEKDLIKNGQDLFRMFSKLSTENQIREDIKAEVKVLIDNNKNWLHRFLSFYLDFYIRIDEYQMLDQNVYEVRDGAKFIESCDWIKFKFEGTLLEDFEKKIELAKKYNLTRR